MTNLAVNILVNHIVVINHLNSVNTKKINKCKTRGRQRGCPHRPRKRQSVNWVFNQLGRKLFRRAYRMTIESFYILYNKIKPHLFQVLNYTTTGRQQNAPNGRIHPTVRLACALRMYAGGDAVDIALAYGISKTEVHNSVDNIIDSVNLTDSISICFPASHSEQQEIAEGFKKKSGADIACCCGAIDGLLIWIEKPTEAECARVKVGSKKFFCGRKHKFGLNLQGTCDSKRRFLSVSIMFPGSTSDFLAFETSSLRTKLEEPGFLAPGLCLFGDNAYVNKPYMCTPYTNVPAGDRRDDFNFYQSQVRINIECAFGMLVNRWGILRKPISRLFGIDKVSKMVQCLCSLHNFLIDERGEPDTNPAPTANDRLNLRYFGGFNTVASSDGTGQVPEQILHGGEHFDDDPGQVMRRQAAARMRRRRDVTQMPCEVVLQLVTEGDYRRPSRRSY